MELSVKKIYAYNPKIIKFHIFVIFEPITPNLFFWHLMQHYIVCKNLTCDFYKTKNETMKKLSTFPRPGISYNYSTFLTSGAKAGKFKLLVDHKINSIKNTKISTIFIFVF